MDSALAASLIMMGTNEKLLAKAIENLSPGDACIVEAIAGADLDAVGFSAALWSLDRSVAIARRLKERAPGVAVVFGGPEILDQARRLDRGSEAAAALDNLAEVYALLAAHGVAGRVTLDLGQVRRMDYYTGIAFEGFAAGMGFPVIGGGRYDNLIGQFGPALPAVGFALTIERVLIALEQAQPVMALHRRVGRLELVEHSLHRPDGAVQESVFADGTRVIANFANVALEAPGVGLVAPESWVSR